MIFCHQKLSLRFAGFAILIAMSLVACTRRDTQADLDSLKEPAELKWTVTDGSNDFGRKVLGSAVDRIFHVVNQGGRSTSGLRFSIDAPFLLMATNCPPTLVSGSQCDVKVRFSADAVGLVSGNLSAVYVSGDSQKSTSLSLQAIALDFPRLRVTSMAFADTLVGASTMRTFTVFNEGGSDATAVRFSSLSGVFTIIRNDCSDEALRPSTSCSIDVRFAPTAFGPTAQDFSIAYQSDFIKQLITTRLEGRGMLPAKLEFAPNQSFNLPDALVNATSSVLSLSIVNSGGVAATNLQTAGLAAPLAITSNDCPATLNAGQTCRVQVTFTPNSDSTVRPLFSVSYQNGVQGAILSATLVATGVNPPPPGTATINNPTERQIFQRSTNTNDIQLTIQGSVTGNADTVQARATVQAGFAGTDTGWVTIASGAHSNTPFSGTLRVMAGGWYTLQVRVLNYNREGAASAGRTFGVGEIFVVAGGSYSTNGGTEPQTTSTGRVVSFNGTDWLPANDPQVFCGDNSTGGSFWPNLGDRLVATLNVPVGFVCVGWNDTSTADWLQNSPTSPVSPGYLFTRLKSTLASFGGRGIRAVLWQHGEKDVFLGTSEGNYYTRMQRIIADTRPAGAAYRWGIAISSDSNPDVCSASNEAAVCTLTYELRRATVAAAQSRLSNFNTNFLGANSDGLLGDPNRAPDYRFTPAGLSTVAERWYQQILSSTF